MSYVDISGLIQSQKDYLIKLDPSSNAVLDFSSINEKLNTLATDLSSNSAAYILTGQDSVHKIISNEKERLNLKKKSVDQAINSQKRLVTFNENYSKKTKEWSKIMMILFFSFFLVFVIQTIKNYLVIIPAIFFSLTNVLILSISFIWVINIYMYNINNRDNTDFDKLSQTSSLLISPKTISDPVVYSGFTTISSSLIKPTAKNDTFSPNSFSDYEFEKYVPYH